MEAKKSSDLGSILLEYVVLNLFVGAVLVLFMQAAFFNLTEGFPEESASFTAFGEKIVVVKNEYNETPGLALKHFYQRIISGISLPIP